MITVLVLMTVGILIGLCIEKMSRLVKITDKLITWAIYLLLFLLGISVGLNDKIINNLDSIGLAALIITVGAVLGSVVVAWGIYTWFFKKANVKPEGNER